MMIWWWLPTEGASDNIWGHEPLRSGLRSAQWTFFFSVCNSKWSAHWPITIQHTATCHKYIQILPLSPKVWAIKSTFALWKRPYGRRHLCSLQQTLQFVVCFCSAKVHCEQSFSTANGANVQQNVHYARCTERTPGLSIIPHIAWPSPLCTVLMTSGCWQIHCTCILDPIKAWDSKRKLISTLVVHDYKVLVWNLMQQSMSKLTVTRWFPEEY